MHALRKHWLLALLLAFGGAPAESQQLQCTSDQAICYSHAGTDVTGYWAFQKTPPSLGGGSALPNTCLRTDLRFTPEGDVIYEILKDRDVAAVTDAEKIADRSLFNAITCFESVARNCNGDPAQPFSWTIFADRDYGEWRVRISKCQMYRDFTAVVLNQGTRITLDARTALQGTPGNADVPQFIWVPDE